ncbi:MAG: hypothetical protein MMC33_003291 [Icmadophila ericetorum]|nr:hypothetical protein [Icmadophila ericetorum]
MAGPAPLIVPALRKHTATVIFAHGLGDTGAGWMSLAENWRRRGKFEEVEFVFPNAPTIPITVNWNEKMPGWYDIVRDRQTTTFNDLQSAHDEPGITRSRDYFQSLIKVEVDKGIPSSRIVIGGFSQGGAMSLFTGLTVPYKLAGFFGLSSYLLMHKKIKDFIPADNPNKETPIFMGHGDADPLVKYDWGVRTAEALRQWGYKVDLKTYRGLQHSAVPEEIDDLERFLKETLPPLGDSA